MRWLGELETLVRNLSQLLCNAAYPTFVVTVNSPNCGHFGTQASVLYSESVLYSGVRVISSPIHVVIMLFDFKASRDFI